MSKVVFVTGSSRGIGKEISKLFAKNNYKVVINCINRKDDLEKTYNELKEINPNILSLQGDISDYTITLDIFKKIENKFGCVDILINNAGISHIGLFNQITPDIWQNLIKTNIEGVFNCSHIACQNMINKKDGIIINISSIWGNVGASCEVVYSATKGAINSFTKALAKELAPSGIRINAISCGAIETEMNNFLSSEEKEEFINEIPYMRFGKPEEVANLAYYLSSKNSSYLTGQIITLDGGLL